MEDARAGEEKPSSSDPPGAPQPDNAPDRSEPVFRVRTKLARGTVSVRTDTASGPLSVVTHLSKDEAEVDVATGKGSGNDIERVHTIDDLKSPLSRVVVGVAGALAFFAPLVSFLFVWSSDIPRSVAWDFWSGLFGFFGAALLAGGAWFGLRHYAKSFAMSPQSLKVKRPGDWAWALVFVGSALLAGTAAGSLIDGWMTLSTTPKVSGG